MEQKKRIWIKTFGCQMNYHDSERILSYLQELNFFQTDTSKNADLILFNTCAIRDLANSKFYSQLGEVKHLKNEKKGLIVGICGCISQIEGEFLLKKYKHLDFALGTDVIDDINKIVLRYMNGERKIFHGEMDKMNNYSIETKIVHNSPQAFINIIKGCNNFCTYCIVPFTRGREISRKMNEIISDVQNLVNKKNIREITLLGQNVNSFGKENNETLAELIYELEKIPKLELLRYTTSHPYDLSDDLIKAHGKSKKLANHLHLAIQSGSDTVLQRMGRKHTVQHYMGLLEKLRKEKPEIVISSDIIVGFPNETEDEFNQTLKFLSKARFDFIYSYAFSKRPHTKAAEMSDCLTREIRSSRLQILQKRQLEIQLDERKKIVGETKKVLIEKFKIKNGQKKWQGRTNCNRIIHFIPENEETDYKWHWAEVKIISATALSCQSTLIHDYGTLT